MSVIVDTAIWSLVLRRNNQNNQVLIINLLTDLVREEKVIMLGVIRQEVLSGIRYQEQFNKLRDYLRAFPDFNICREDYELAAQFFNICRSNGIQGSNNDFLICAVAYRYNYQIFTTDKDFQNFQLHIPIKLINFQF
jgi:predicted nucleic acid-binding protein